MTTPTLYCPECGYNLTGLTEHRCPECGEVYDLNKLSIWRAAQVADSGSITKAILLAPVLVVISSPILLMLALVAVQVFGPVFAAAGFPIGVSSIAVVTLVAAVLPVTFGFYLGLKYASGYWHGRLDRYSGPRIWPAWVYMIAFSGIECLLTCAYSAVVVLAIMMMAGGF